MAGKLLRKLKDMLKHRPHSSHHRPAAAGPSSDAACRVASVDGGDKQGDGLHLVYVGKSRRRYLISSDVIDHPLFQIIAQRHADGDSSGGAATVVGCEVVLFEHLLWMLVNADLQPDSVDELVEYYTC
ncbi:auxin-responsive protein SAUR78-like [Musa acuminata AAA Group]|uniref:auxin-responsive protein SAUR78-like n=1 Tax=Musa acuminata AAA Group TaxID=214697 RepID=UPI0031D34E04